MTSPWADYDPANIPSKSDLSELESFLERLPEGARVLDLGCGSGGVSRTMARRGFAVVGVDINADAIAHASGSGGGGRFVVRDLASPKGLRLDDAPFSAVVCQLVLSVVGKTGEREALLENARDALELGGLLYLSASEVSDDVNPAYEKLYRDDFPETGERYTYYSRDSDGCALYETHHFTGPELSALIETAGFELMQLVSKTESSSRRKDQKANFLYATARKI